MDSSTLQNTADGPDSGAKMEEHPLYAMVLKMVLWGEKKEDVYHRMQVNGIESTTADLIYGHARADRIATIRDVYRRKFIIGVGLLIAGVTTFSIFWFGAGFIPRFLLYGCFAAVGFGAWKIIDGVAGTLMAANREGSVADET